MSLFKVYFAFFKFVILSNLSKATCPPISTPGNNGKCYSFFDTQGDFNSAERGCTEVGGHLVSICNAFENNILAEVAVGKLQAYGAKDFWIGYNDQFSKGVWNWTSNSNCTYLNWNGGQFGNSDCASFQISGGKWQGSNCTAPKAFVCETYSENQSVKVKPMCKNGYTYHDDWNTCYKYFTAGLNWNDAEKSCVNDGGHLVSIHSIDEKIFIDELMLQVGVSSVAWIGYYSTSPQNPSNAQFWGWTDHTPSSYSLWHPNFPVNAFTCAGMRSSGNPYNPSNNGSAYWGNDLSCTTAVGYICKQFPICG